MNAIATLFATALIVAVAAAPLTAAEAASDDALLRTIAVNNLVYARNKTSKCFSDQFMREVARDTRIRTETGFRRAHLAQAGELFASPFSIMNGEDAFAFTDDERDNLRLYLEGGGFLLASAGCSSSAWSASFRREIQRSFGAGSLVPIGTEHRLFHCLYDIDQVPLKNGGYARFEGLIIDGRLACLFSPEGLNNTASVEGCCCCSGNEVKTASRVVANALVYALLE